MPNLLAHALFAGAVYGALWYLLRGEPITEYAFVSALVALLPDLDLHGGDKRTRYGHSLGYGAFYMLLTVSGLNVALALGIMEPPLLFPLGLATGLGLTTHLLLDSITDPGIFGFPRKGDWDRFSLSGRRRKASPIDGWVSFVSAAFLVVLLALG